LIKLENALDIEVFELFKPQEAVPPDTKAIVNQCLASFSESLKVSFEESLKDLTRKIQKNL
jgi:hypothetical protein